MPQSSCACGPAGTSAPLFRDAFTPPSRSGNRSSTARIANSHRPLPVHVESPPQLAKCLPRLPDREFTSGPADHRLAQDLPPGVDLDP